MISLNLPTRFVPDRVSYSRAAGWLDAGERRTYANLEGPGCIRHVWMTVSRTELSNRKCILRWYFDGAETPHVEAPVGDFFGVMHGQMWYPLNTQYLSAQAESGYNCYFPMPFATSARLELEAGDEGLPVYLMVDWHRYPNADFQEKRRFCARWRRECPAERHGKDFLMLDAEGPGQFLGFVYGVRLLDDTDRWSHAGADNFYGDGETETPFYLRGIGGEDTFGTSYGGAKHPPETHLHTGMPFYRHEDVGEARVAQRLVGYRFFDRDTIPFQRSLHLRFGSMANDICATAYWYQEGAPREFTRLPSFEQLLPSARKAPKLRVLADEHDLPLPDCGSWWLCGPFAELDADNFMNALPPENGEIDSAQVFDGGHAADSLYLAENACNLGRDKARWARGESLRGFVDFNHYFRCAAPGVTKTFPAVAVARAKIHVDAPCRAFLTLSWDDRLALRINDGAPLDMGTHPHFRSKTVEVELHAGANEIMIKLSNSYGTNHGGWVFALRLVTEAGKVLLPRIS